MPSHARSDKKDQKHRRRAGKKRQQLDPEGAEACENPERRAEGRAVRRADRVGRRQRIGKEALKRGPGNCESAARSHGEENPRQADLPENRVHGFSGISPGEFREKLPRRDLKSARAEGHERAEKKQGQAPRQKAKKFLLRSFRHLPAPLFSAGPPGTSVPRKTPRALRGLPEIPAPYMPASGAGLYIFSTCSSVSVTP